jgi:hypothetical protein
MTDGGVTKDQVMIVTNTPHNIPLWPIHPPTTYISGEWAGKWETENKIFPVNVRQKIKKRKYTWQTENIPRIFPFFYLFIL